jgi:hypothetical protein
MNHIGDFLTSEWQFKSHNNQESLLSTPFFRNFAADFKKFNLTSINTYCYGF